MVSHLHSPTPPVPTVKLIDQINGIHDKETNHKNFVQIESILSKIISCVLIVEAGMAILLWEVICMTVD